MRSYFLLSFLLVSSCSSPQQPAGGAAGGGGNGTLYFSFSVSLKLHKLNLATCDDAELGVGDAPVPTPDGRLIFSTPTELVESDESMAMHRIIVDTDYTGMKPWTVGFRGPNLSPDGTKIAYVTHLEKLYVVNRADGAVLKRHETGGYTRVTWTPDGRLVAGGAFSNKGIHLSDASLDKFERIDPMLADPRDPAVAPDGSKVAFVLNRRLHVMNIDGSGFKKIDESEDESSQPSWSPDSSKVIYRVSGHLKIMPAEGGAASDLFDLCPGLKKHSVLTGSNPVQWR